MRIVRLSTSNVKRIRAADITPTGNLVRVGGPNGAGKSSLLDSIAYTLGGKDVMCQEPLRRGEERGEVEVDLGEFVVKRTFTPGGGGTLTVSTKDGAKFPAPQAKLNDIVGALSFDPLGFSRMEPREQGETLRKLLGLDFSEIDAERAKLYAQRTEMNREVASLRARATAMPEHADAPDSPVSVADVLAEMEAAQAVNAENRRQRDVMDTWRVTTEDARKVAAVVRERRDETARQIAVLKETLDVQVSELQDALERIDADDSTVANLAPVIEGLQDVDLRQIKQRMVEVEAVNAKHMANAARNRALNEVEAKTCESKDLTIEIDELDERKVQMLASVEAPVPGLGLAQDGTVTLAGLPFDQASSAEQLRTSVAIGMRLNPRLKVLLVRDGSLLDADSLAALASMADDNAYQVWLETVSSDGVSVIIEDGLVRGAEPETATQERML